MSVVFNPLAAEHPEVAVLATVVLLVDLALLDGLLYAALRRLGYSIEIVEERVKPFLYSNYRWLSVAVALTATAGSLYMSNVLGWTPCRLCWFQRILMYPLVIVGGVGALLEKDDVRDYLVPLAAIGLPIAVYHAVIQRFEQFSSAGCSVTEVSCETTYTFFYGYISVPVMAATAFAAVLVLAWKFGRDRKMD